MTQKLLIERIQNALFGQLDEDVPLEGELHVYDNPGGLCRYHVKWQKDYETYSADVDSESEISRIHKTRGPFRIKDERKDRRIPILREARLDASPYETTMGKSPKGHNEWAFGLDFYPTHPNDFKTKRNQILELGGDFQQTSKHALKIAKQKGVKVVYVLPN